MCQPETNQILKIEDVAIVSSLTKHFAFFFYSPGRHFLPTVTQLVSQSVSVIKDYQYDLYQAVSLHVDIGPS